MVENVLDFLIQVLVQVFNIYDNGMERDTQQLYNLIEHLWMLLADFCLNRLMKT